MRYLLIALLLAGCASGADQSAGLEKRFGPTCNGLGLEKGTPPYVDCILKLNHTVMTY